MLVSATNIYKYSILCVGVMLYEAEESHIRKLFEEVLDEESNVEFGCESDLWSDHQSDSDHKLNLKTMLILKIHQILQLEIR